MVQENLTAKGAKNAKKEIGRSRAKHVLSNVEGTPSTQRKTFINFSEPWRPLRLCARHSFSDIHCEITSMFG
jgi:hypothetical protein